MLYCIEVAGNYFGLKCRPGEPNTNRMKAWKGNVEETSTAFALSFASSFVSIAFQVLISLSSSSFLLWIPSDNRMPYMFRPSLWPFRCHVDSFQIERDTKLGT